jgi:hypothetical protein
MIADSEVTTESPTACVTNGAQSAVLGLQRGHQSDRKLICRACGQPFTPDVSNVRKGRGFFCSVQCSNATRLGRFVAGYDQDDKARRVRANGLVNKRIKLGHLKRPDRCERCGERSRTDGHHPDYSRPLDVVFLCRSCHMRLHSAVAVEEGTPSC